jgi:hypothetical protein
MRNLCHIILFSLLLAPLVLAQNPTTDEPRLSDAERTHKLLQDLETMDIAGMEVLEVKPYSVPEGAGIFVMRVRLEETYAIDGVGKDTVELTGWIAVKHDAPYAQKGASELNWNTAVTPTEFIALNLKGESEIFGPVYLKLNPDHPCLGQVGGVDIPVAVEERINARYEQINAMKQKQNQDRKQEE